MEKAVKEYKNYRIEVEGVGREATATITTVMAGGFNIQRLHYRTLVKVKK